MIRVAIALVLMLAARAHAAETGVVLSTANVAAYISEIEKGEKGNPLTQYTYGIRCFQGTGVPKDEAKGAGIMRLVAERGYASAQHALGAIVTNGEGVKKDALEGLSWYEKAAEQGNYYAQFALADAYAQESGSRDPGRPLDAEKSYFWATLAMLSDDRDFAEALDALGILRKSLMNQLPPERVAALDARLRAWEPKRGLAWKGQEGIAAHPCFLCIQRAADAGESQDQVILGNLYREGLVMPKDPVQAAIWYRRSAEQGNLDGQRKLALVYLFGTGVTKDAKEALFWLIPVVDYSHEKGWIEQDKELRMMLSIAHKEVGEALSEEILLKARAWKPTPEKKAAKGL